MDYWKLAAAMLALLGILLAVLLAAPPVMAEKAPPVVEKLGPQQEPAPLNENLLAILPRVTLSVEQGRLRECACDNKVKVTAQVFRS